MNATILPTMSKPSVFAVRKPLSRNAVVGLAVVGLHVVFIWALQQGLVSPTVDLIVPAEILVQFIDPPAPQVVPAPPPPIPPAPVIQKKQPVARAPARPQPQPLAILDTPTPSPNAPTGVITPLMPLMPALTALPAPVATAPSTAASAPPAMQLPSSDADYLQNPKPPYPALSKRLNEQGRTVIRVLIGVDGLPQRAEVAKSSGYDRLDQAASTTVMRWRFVPGKRNGVAEAMWFNVPINWVLE